MILVTGTVTTRADGFDAMLAEAKAHVARSRAEDGCISHAVAIDGDDPLTLVFVERWRDAAALRVHFAQPGSHALMAAVKRHAVASTLQAYDAREIAPG